MKRIFTIFLFITAAVLSLFAQSSVELTYPNKAYIWHNGTYVAIEAFDSLTVKTDTLTEADRYDNFDLLNNSVFNIVTIKYAGLESKWPTIMVNTPDLVPIESKEIYIDNTKISFYEKNEKKEYNCKIRGRGNSSWDKPKKPYKFKLEEKKSLLGFPKDKEWILVTNHSDPTMMRNEVAFWMGSQYGKFDYVPRFQYVDLILNEKYNGLYQLGEHLKISKDRMNVGDDGFLLEVDSKADSTAVTFKVINIKMPINIKEPNVAVGDDDFNYISEYLYRADSILFSKDWLDEEKGYKTLLDMESYVEWFLVNEITKNCDASFNTSCYMNKTRNGKLKMGPLWDFDVSLGNYFTDREDLKFLNETDGFHVIDHFWYKRFAKDPAFKATVKERYDNYYNHKADIMAHIDSVAMEIKSSVIINNRKWEVLCYRQSDISEVEESFFNEVEYLKTWLSERMDWLKSAFDKW